MGTTKNDGYHGKKAMPHYIIPDPAPNQIFDIPKTKTITEAKREVQVFTEADVVVVGGGPGGVTAAISAARKGAKVVLLERYGHLGGMGTGGLVNIIPNMADIFGKRYIRGICEEFIQRMDAQDAIFMPLESEWGTTDQRCIDYYRHSNFNHFFIRKNEKGEDTLIYSAVFDPEVAKNEINRMIAEAGVKLLLHSWVTEPIVEGNKVKGVIFQSKSGRKAILSKVVIDASGDGDMLPLSGAKTEDNIDPRLRIAFLCFSFWVGGVELRAYDKFISQRPAEYDALQQELAASGLYVSFFRGVLKNREDVVWFHPHFIAKCQTDVEEMTRMDVAGREKAVRTWELLRKKAPGFEKSYIVLTAPQLGTTGGRRLVGEYVLTEKDFVREEPFPDTIAVFPNNDRKDEITSHSTVTVPYRALVPAEVDGLLVACRAFSSNDEANAYFNLIPHCMCLGQAAGTAAAIAAAKGINVREVPYEELRQALIEQNVCLPEK